MKFTLTDLHSLYHDCKIIGWAEGTMSTVKDADVLFVADTNHNIIAQFENVCDNDDFMWFELNVAYVSMLGRHTIDLMEWLDGRCTIKEF
jgi:hypothetical protein